MDRTGSDRHGMAGVESTVQDRFGLEAKETVHIGKDCFGAAGMDYEEAYSHMLRTTNCPWCWACGRGENDRPIWWYAPFMVERAHFASKPRIEDRRLVVLLCSGCHKTSHGERIHGWDLPKLSRANLLWLKARFDPEYFDPSFIQKHLTVAMPMLDPPMQIFYAEYERRRGVPWQS